MGFWYLDINSDVTPLSMTSIWLSIRYNQGLRCIHFRNVCENMSGNWRGKVLNIDHKSAVGSLPLIKYVGWLVYVHEDAFWTSLPRRMQGTSGTPLPKKISIFPWQVVPVFFSTSIWFGLRSRCFPSQRAPFSRTPIPSECLLRRLYLIWFLQNYLCFP